MPQTSYTMEQAVGFTGQLDKKAPYATLTVKNAAAASMRRGIGVIRKAAATSDFQADLPGVETDRVLGITLREETFARTWTDQDGNIIGQLDGTGYVVGTMLNVVTHGRMLVECRSGCTAGDGLFVRCTANSGDEYVGALEDADDGTETIVCSTQGTWQTSAAAGGLAWLEFDFRNI